MKSSPEKVMGHTEGKVEYQERSDAYTHIIRGEGYKMIACTPQGSSGTEEADARRLVACWNALDGVPTEWLENYVAGGAENLLQENAALIKERDELVKALRSARDYLDEQYPMVDASELLDEEIDPILSRYPENK